MSKDSTAHLADEQIIDLLIDPDRAAEDARAHLPCDQCTPRILRLQREWLEVQAAIGQVDLPPGFVLPKLPAAAARTPQRGIGWAAPAVRWRLAAGICLLFGAGVVSATTPLDTWVVEWLSGKLDGRRGETVAVPESPRGPPDRQENRGGRISFPVSGPTLDVELVHRQGSGRIVLYPVEQSGAQIDVAGAAGNEMPLIRRDGIQIRNSVQSEADYRIGVPAGVTHVRVRMAGAPVRLISRARIMEEGSIELSPGNLTERGPR